MSYQLSQIYGDKNYTFYSLKKKLHILYQDKINFENKINYAQ